MKLHLRLIALVLAAIPSGDIGAQQPDKLVHSITAPYGQQLNTRFGSALATEGGYTVVGSAYADTGAKDAGLVKILNSATGAEILRLPSPNPSDSFGFGTSVAISGTRVVVGAMQVSFGGFAYVYDLAGPTPSVPIHVIANPTPSNTDRFGSSVAIDGTRVVVGAATDDTVANDSGSVYVYDIGSGTPTVPVLSISDPAAAASDWFGSSMALSGSRLIVGSVQNDAGASNAGVAFVFDLDGLSPQIPIHTILNPTPGVDENFSNSVAISGNTVLVAASGDSTDLNRAGSVYAYDLSGATPTTPLHGFKHPTPQVFDYFGSSVAITGSRVIVGAYNDTITTAGEGSAFLFDLSSATPTVAQLLVRNPDPAQSDAFGISVTISGTRAMVGAPYDDAAGKDSGTVYFYDFAGSTPTVPTGSASSTEPSANDQIGGAVAVSGRWMVAGAGDDGSNLQQVGIVHVYDLASDTPGIPAFTLRNPSPAAFDYFGEFVGISGTRIVVGASGDDTGATNAGSAYVFDLASATPALPVAVLNNPVLAGDSLYGTAVAISGPRVVVGAYREDTSVFDAGRVYVYDLSSGTPSQPVVVLAKTAPAESDYFGHSVGISGSRVVVGAYRDDTASTNAGAAYVYDVAANTATLLAILTNPGLTAADAVGYSVAISGTRVVAGAIYDANGNNQSGSAYVYDLAGASPTMPVVSIINPQPGFTDWFGSPVAISGTRVLVGALQDDTGANDSGSAYLFDVSGATPGLPVATLNNPTPGASDKFSKSLAIDGLVAAIGAPNDDTAAIEKGMVYVYVPETNGPAGGSMTVNPVSPVDPGAALTVQFAGWTDATPPLTYQVLVDGVVVAPAGASAHVLITAPSVAGSHVVKGRITDAVGNTSHVSQSITVLTAQETWRKQYFGLPFDYGPGADDRDPDGDGHDNLFEFLAGLDPTDAASRFLLRIESVEGQPKQKAIIFSPLVAGRNYRVMEATSLENPTWQQVGPTSTLADGGERTIIDASAMASRKFYVVEILKP